MNPPLARGDLRDVPELQRTHQGRALDFCTSCGTQLRPAPTTAADAPVTQQAPGQPAPGQPAPGQPAPGQPAPGQPAPGQPAPGQPVRFPFPPGPPGQVRRTSSPAYSFDLKRLAPLDRTVGGATFVVFVALFLPWFGILGYTTSGISLHGYLVIALLAALALLLYLALRAGWETAPFRLPIAHAPLLLIGTGVQLLFVLIAFLQSDGLSHEFGAYLALLAALVACAAIAVPVIRSARSVPQQDRH